MVYIPKNRWQAFAYHLLISFCVFIALLLIITRFWYPGVFMDMGGWHGVTIAAVVDLVLGPVLTLFVYNLNKKHLKWDMAAIVVFQFACLMWGMWFVYQERPMIQVLSIDAVFIHTYSDLESKQIDLSELDAFSGPSPSSLYVELPASREDAVDQELQSLMNTAKPLDLRLDKMRELTAEASQSVMWRFKKEAHDISKDCYWLEIISTHYSGEGCLHLDKGLVALRASTIK